MEEEETNPHSLALECLCRVCGKRACPSKRQRSVYKCANYITDLQTTFGIKTSDDDPLIHPVNFCHGCKGTVYNFKNGKISAPTFELFDWQPHQEHECTTCTRAKEVRKGGRPAKLNIGRPAAVGRREALSHIRSIAPPTHHVPHHTQHTFSTLPQYAVTVDDLTCCLCLNVLDQPVELTSCVLVVCANCLCKWLAVCPDSLPCPCCHRNLQNLDTIQSASSVVQKLIGGLLVACTCGSRVVLEGYSAHRDDGCSPGSDACQTVSVQDIMARPIDSPLSLMERELQTTLAKRSLATASEGNIIRMKTGGQVQSTRIYILAYA